MESPFRSAISVIFGSSFGRVAEGDQALLLILTGRVCRAFSRALATAIRGRRRRGRNRAHTTIDREPAAAASSSLRSSFESTSDALTTNLKSRARKPRRLGFVTHSLAGELLHRVAAPSRRRREVIASAFGSVPYVHRRGERGTPRRRARAPWAARARSSGFASSPASTVAPSGGGGPARWSPGARARPPADPARRSRVGACWMSSWRMSRSISAMRSPTPWHRGEDAVHRGQGTRRGERRTERGEVILGGGLLRDVVARREEDGGGGSDELGRARDEGAEHREVREGVRGDDAADVRPPSPEGRRRRRWRIWHPRARPRRRRREPCP